VKREEKAQVIERLAEKLRAGSAVLVDYQGMDVARSTDLRRRSRESGVEFVVAKNTLAKRAADEAGVEGLQEFCRARRRWRSRRTRWRARSSWRSSPTR
jgi:large subunit ribosomal protein L10